ncbi:MAG: DUF72 domain-containing protein [Methanomassiliicoccales archaeon]
MILVGCSGWSYEDWLGRFYPWELANKRGEWLRFYAEHFHTVEINSTFYRPPPPPMVRLWIKKAEGLEGFEYSLKMPRLVTHESMVQLDSQTSATQAVSFERMCVKELSAAARMGACLLQLSPYFKKDSRSMAVLDATLEALDTQAYHYAVEFRHRSWLGEEGKEIDPEALDLLKRNKAATVMVDGPGFPVIKATTAEHAYIRFHGRNYDIWFREEGEEDHRLNRYDYLYTKEQLWPWVPRIQEAARDHEKVRIYFNNHGRSKAVRNAFDLMDMLGIPHKAREIRLQDQYTLGNF